MSDMAPEIKRGRKFDQVVQGAREVFLRHGFEGASVDDIAKEANVSKATLYSYFPDKRLLFMEVLSRECMAQADQAQSKVDLSLPFRDLLSGAVEEIITLLVQQSTLQMHRICVGEAERFPEVGKMFYEFGPQLGRARIVEQLQMFAAKGDVVIDDFELAADQLIGLCKADLIDRALFELKTDFSEAEIARVRDGAVRMFMAAYGPK